MENRKTLFYAWVVWTVAALFYFYKFVIEVSPSIMTKDLLSAFHLSGAQLGSLAASYFYAYLLMQIPVGLLVDRFGPRKVVTVAIFFCALGTFIFATSPNLLVASIGRFIVGLGAAFAAINSLKLTSNWFPPHRFAFMAGLLMTIGMLGAVGGQAPLSYYISHAGSWRTAMTHISWVGALLALLFWLIVRDYPKHIKEETFQFNGQIFWRGCKKILSNPQNWLLSIFSGLLFTPVMAFGELWGVTFIKDVYQMEKQAAAFAVSAMFIGFGISAPLFGLLSDYIGKRKPIMFFGTVASFLTVCFILYVPFHHEALAYLLLFLLGSFVTTFMLSFTMIREVNVILVVATAIGFMNTFNAIMGAISDPLIGALLDARWEGVMNDGARVFSISAYRFALSTLPIYLLIGFILLFFIKETYCKQTQAEPV